MRHIMLLHVVENAREVCRELERQERRAAAMGERDVGMTHALRSEPRSGDGCIRRRQRELATTALDGRQQLMRPVRYQNEVRARWWLFQVLEQRICRVDVE